MTRDINPAVGKLLASARDMLMHEHSLFGSLGLEPILIGRGKASFGVDLPADFAGADGKVHGSLLTLIMDSIFGITVFTSLDVIKPIATVNLRADYLDHATPGGRAVCAAECVAVRDEIAYVEGEMRSQGDDRLLARGSGAFMVGTRGAAPGSRL